MMYLTNTDDPGLRAQYGSPAFQVVAGPGGNPTQLVGFNQSITEEQAALGIVALTIVTAGVVGSTYHGYRRTGSAALAAAWGVMGLLFPVPTLAYAAGQGFAKPA